MKGLLIKDFNLMKNQKRFFIVVIIIAAMMFAGSSDGMFGVAYVTILCTFFVLSTFSYDDFDNGGSYLMTLPITRKIYVKEKYVLGICLAIVSWIVSSVLAYFIGCSKGAIDQPNEWWIAVISYLALAGISLAIMIPIQIKFGTERSRIVLMIIFGVLFIIGMGASKIFSSLELDFFKAIEVVNNLEITGVAIALVMSVIVALVISFVISKKIIEKKEY